MEVANQPDKPGEEQWLATAKGHFEDAALGSAGQKIEEKGSCQPARGTLVVIAEAAGEVARREQANLQHTRRNAGNCASVRPANVQIGPGPAIEVQHTAVDAVGAMAHRGP